MTIKILGGGCPKCQKLYENTKGALTQTGLEAEVLKITDMVSIMKYKVLSTPALVIDDTVVSMGKVLDAQPNAKLLQ